MTIITTQSRITYAGDNVTTGFPIPFEFFLTSDITAVKTAVGGAQSILVLNVDYTLAGAGVIGGGSLIKTSALLAGETLAIFLNPPIEQESHYQSNSPFPSGTLENDLDRQTQISQRLQDQINHAIRAPDGDASPGMVLPPASARANLFSAFDASGNVIAVSPPAVLAPQVFGPGDVRNYGGVSGTDCAAAVAASAAGNKQVIFPAGVWPMAGTPSIPLGVVLSALPGSSFSGAGAAVLGLTNVDSYQFNVNEGDTVTGPAFRDVIRINHSYGGAAMQGGRCSFEVQCGLTSTSSVSNTNRNYVAGNFEVNISANDTGTSAGSNLTAAGAAFGIGVNCVLFSGATCFENATAAEFNIDCHTGSSVYYRSIIQLAELATSAVQGQGFDVMLSLSNQGGVGFQTGIGFNNANSTHPVTATGTLIATQGAHTVAGGVDLSSYTFTAQSFVAKGFAVQGVGTQVDLGLVGSANTYLANFHTGAVGTTYDSRIVAFGGTGSSGGGTLVFNSTALGFYDSGAGVAKQTVSGAKGGNTALASLLTALAGSGLKLVIDTTT